MIYSKMLAWPTVGTLVLVLTSAAADAATEYTTQAAFNAVVTGATTYNFDGIVPPTQVVNTNATVGGVAFTDTAPANIPFVFGTGNSQYGGASFFTGQTTQLVIDPSVVDVSPASGTTAIGFNYGAYLDANQPITVTVNGSDTFSLLTPANNGVDTLFVGFTSSTPITSVHFEEQGYTMDITQFVVATAVPVPASVWLFTSALGLLGLRRRPAATA